VSTTVDLPDLNVWLALACPDHSHHRQAADYWEQQAAEQVLFCTVTALGLVRLVCQPKLLGAAVQTAAEASALLDAFCQQPGVSLASAEQAGWEVFHQLLRSGELPPRLCTDAYLAALAIANGWRLVSLDRDFERFEGLERLAL
jgi:toxin-antitoxin system PIN domain toxin